MEWMRVWSERLLWGCLAHGSAIEIVVNSKQYSVSECDLTPASSQLLRRGSFLSFYLELHVHTCTAALKFLEAVKPNWLLIAEKSLKFCCCNFLKQELPKCSVHYAFVNKNLWSITVTFGIRSVAKFPLAEDLFWIDDSYLQVVSASITTCLIPAWVTRPAWSVCPSHMRSFLPGWHPCWFRTD